MNCCEKVRNFFFVILDPEKIIISSGSPLNFWKTCQDSKKMTWIPSELGCLWINLLTNAMGGFHYFKKSMLSSGPDRTSITPLIYSFLTNGAKCSDFSSTQSVLSDWFLYIRISVLGIISNKYLPCQIKRKAKAATLRSK